MTSLLAIVSLLSALTATGSALSCTECMSLTSSSCSGSSVTCPPGYLCASDYAEIEAAGQKISSVMRSCAPSSECNLKGSVSMTYGKARSAMSCCSTDNCTPTLPSLPTRDSTPNGVTCRSCASADSTWCYTSDTIQCNGDENMCILQTTQMTGSMSLSSALRGCATKSLCDFGSRSKTIEGATISVKATCTSDGVSVRNVLLTPAIVCLLLLKVFF
ncbi:hypothetical protein GDO81_028170 [Engystomops pustulosus]|uniref:UPAR/Ly6 domain-containing protein n=1 Tax=Engystomops pustulosus TaxID=76066 RepID=A0AAV6ZS69_ENGPU|nr:hypothetical protein GDO81_028170 [Engystomops pustulosus]KAG8550145.1 hypothetical protein GDO81_028170 [Engystomops pustulosus]